MLDRKFLWHHKGSMQTTMSTCREALRKTPIAATLRGHCTGRGPLDISSW